MCLMQCDIQAVYICVMRCDIPCCSVFVMLFVDSGRLFWYEWICTDQQYLHHYQSFHYCVCHYLWTFQTQLQQLEHSAGTGWLEYSCQCSYLQRSQYSNQFLDIGWRHRSAYLRFVAHLPLICIPPLNPSSVSRITVPVNIVRRLSNEQSISQTLRP